MLKEMFGPVVQVAFLFFNPNGKLLGRIVTNERTSNCTIGDDGWLYITADSNLCRVKTTAMPIKFK